MTFIYTSHFWDPDLLFVVLREWLGLLMLSINTLNSGGGTGLIGNCRVLVSVSWSTWFIANRRLSARAWWTSGFLRDFWRRAVYTYWMITARKCWIVCCFRFSSVFSSFLRLALRSNWISCIREARFIKWSFAFRCIISDASALPSNVVCVFGSSRKWRQFGQILRAVSPGHCIISFWS